MASALAPLYLTLHQLYIRPGCSHAGAPVVRRHRAVSEPGGSERSREEEAADRHQEAGGQLPHQVPQGRRVEHALHGQAGGRHRVRQQHPPRQTLHLHPGHRPGDQRLGPGPAGHVRGREEEAGHPRRAGLRRPGSPSEDPRGSDAHLRSGAAEHREAIRPLMKKRRRRGQLSERKLSQMCASWSLSEGLLRGDSMKQIDFRTRSMFSVQCSIG